MHPSAYETARRFFETHWRDDLNSIVEFGAMDVNGSLSSLCSLCPEGVRWLGIDTEAGPGVDMIVSPANRVPVEDGWFDAAVSSSHMEHDPCFWFTFEEMARVVRPGGLIYINAPSVYKIHRHPMDYWRFNIDAAMALEQWAKVQGFPVDLIEAGLSAPDAEGQQDFSAVYARL